MDNIYHNQRYTFNISEEDQQLVLNQMCTEFGVTYAMVAPPYVVDMIEFIYNRKLSVCIKDNLWKGSPTFSNIRYLLHELGISINGSDVERLCQQLCAKYIG